MRQPARPFSGSSPLTRGKRWTVSHTRRKAGSSPLTRGKRGDAPACAAFFGLIPAHAGKTSYFADVRKAGQAHPRSRGENAALDEEGAGVEGSSPLTRGKPGDTVPRSPNTGLIPAHAGKTRRASSCGLTTAAHPRSRGENGLGRGRAGRQRGSSPLTRGKPLGPASGIAVLGLIPAHAGKTGCFRARRR